MERDKETEQAVKNAILVTQMGAVKIFSDAHIDKKFMDLYEKHETITKCFELGLITFEKGCEFLAKEDKEFIKYVCEIVKHANHKIKIILGVCGDYTPPLCKPFDIMFEESFIP